MEDKVIIQKLAVERCQLSVSHLYAMQHMLGDTMGEQTSNSFKGLFESLSKDLALIEKLISE